MSIEDERKKIDALDAVIAEKLLERLECVKKIGELKASKNLQIKNQARENEIIKKFRKICTEENQFFYLESIYKKIFDASIQEEGSYSIKNKN